MVLTSLENEQVKDLVKLQQKKYRDLTGTYLVEGDHLVEEAEKHGVLLKVFCVLGEEISSSVPVVSVSVEVMKKISTMDTPSIIVGLCKKQEEKEIQGNKILLLDEIQDPGNLGTIIRSAVAFGFDEILLSENTVDLYNPKVLRGTQGIYTHIPIMSVAAKDAISSLKEKGYVVYGTNVRNGVDVRSLTEEEKEKFCFIVGNEGRGVREEILDLCDKNLYIAMQKDVESLNVGVACSILLYELGRK